MRLRSLGVIVLIVALAMIMVGCNVSTAEPTATTSESAPAATVSSSKSHTDDEATPAPTLEEAEPTDAPEEEATEAPAEEGLTDEELNIADSAALAQFNSYRMSNVITWEMEDGTSNSFEMTTEFVREPAAQRIVMTGSPQDGQEPVDMEIIQIGDATYMRMGANEEWISLSSDDSGFTDDASWFTDPDSFVDSSEAEYVGTETVNGYESKHYSYEDEGLDGLAGMTTVDHVQSDVWVSTELGIATKIVISYEGTDSEGLTGTWSMESNLTDVDADIVIEPPEGVAAPGLPEDVPMLEGATEVTAMGTMVTYSVAMTPGEAAAQIQSGMESSGWTYNDASSMSPDMLSFTKDTRSTTVYISEEDGGASITVMVAEAGAE
ncbi:MAG: hypothetical protein ACYC4R_03985 [Anaerolineae bacterium]